MISVETINRCITRERTALRETYEACAPYVYSIIKSYIYDEHLRKDAMQESFANIFHSIERFDPNRGSFKSWIAKITVNQSISLLRSRGKLKLFVPIEGAHEELGYNEESIEEMSREEIENLLQEMPTGYRAIFLLNIIEGYNHTEISDMLNITKETSRSQLSRSLRWIRNNLVQKANTYFYG